MCDRFRISPRVAFKGEPIDLSKQKGLTPERYPITPVKVVDRPLTDPWTPTANLKMLSSVASPEIRDREKKKELFRPIENNEPEDTGLDAQQVRGKCQPQDGTVHYWSDCRSLTCRPL